MAGFTLIPASRKQRGDHCIANLPAVDALMKKKNKKKEKEKKKKNDNNSYILS